MRIGIHALLVLLGLWASPLPAAPDPAAHKSPSGGVRFAYVVYIAGEGNGEPRAVLDEHPLVISGALALVDEIAATPIRPVVQMTVVENAQTELPPPPRDALAYLSRGLPDDEIEPLYRASKAVVLEFAHPRATALSALARADAVAGHLASRMQGLVYDVELRRVIGSDHWQTERRGDPAKPAPSVLEHTAIHAYRDSEWIRSVTVGMKKLGLPELVIDEHAADIGMPLGWIINGIAQRLVEGQRPDREGWFELDLRAIQHPAVRAGALEDLKSNASARGRFRLIETPPEEGDADNLVWAIGFQDFDGPDLFARQAAAVASIFGWTDEVKFIAHDDALRAASEQAQRKLPAIRAVVQRGFQPGEVVQVKLPFPTPDGGTEWMWVEVVRWDGDTIEGVLNNEPFQIPDLHAGQRVRGKTTDVFDYLYLRADGSTEGNQTSEIIERMQGEIERRGGE